MQKIKFLKDGSIHDATLKLTSNRMICVFNNYSEITDDLISGGFVELNEHNDMIQGNYEDYKYIYKKEDGNSTIILTTAQDDVYVEPEIPSVSDSDIIEYVPTIDDIKKQKINELSNAKTLEEIGQCVTSLTNLMSDEVVCVGIHADSTYMVVKKGINVFSNVKYMNIFSDVLLTK